MSEALTGEASWSGCEPSGVGGTQVNIAYTGPAYLDHRMGDFTVSDYADIRERMNGDGELVGLGSRNARRDIVLNTIPRGVTKANAKAGAVAPVKNSKVVLANFPEPSVGYINGDWIFKGEKGDFDSKWDVDDMKVTLKLVRTLTSPLSVTQLTTAVS